VISSTDNDCAILSLLENLHREDLSFLEIAESYRELVKKRGISSRDISRKLGGLPFEIKERINLMKLDPLVRKYIRNFNLSERQAKALLKIRDSQLQIDTVRNICQNGLSEEDTIQFINNIIDCECQPDIHINKMKDMRILKNTLANAVNIIKQSGISADYKENVYDWGEEFIIVIKNPVV
jgi:ParB family chromosome partitioning protein